MALSITGRIAAPVDRVFAVFTDLRNAAGRIRGITRLEVLTDGPIGRGTRFRETRIMFKKEATETMEIVDFQPNRSYTVACTSCGAEMRSNFRFTPVGNQTDVTMEMDARPISFMAKLLSPVMKLMMGPMMRKCIQGDFDDLKRYIEGAPAAPAVAAT